MYRHKQKTENTQRLKPSLFIGVLAVLLAGSAMMIVPGSQTRAADPVVSPIEPTDGNREDVPPTSTPVNAAPQITPVAAGVTPVATSTNDVGISIEVKDPKEVKQAPDLAIVKVDIGKRTYHVGDKVTFVVVVSNVTNAGPAFDLVVLKDVIPAGLKDIQVKGDNWSIDDYAKRGPTTITATFKGIYPVLPGTVLAPIVITGHFDDAAVPTFTNAAAVFTQHELNTQNNVAYDTVVVKKREQNNNNNDHQNNDHNNNNNHNNNDNDHNNNNNNNNNDHNNNDHNNNDHNNNNNNNTTTTDNQHTTNAVPALPLTGSDPNA